MLGSTPTRRCSSCGILLVGKVAHLCRVETYSNSPCPRYWASYGVVSPLVFTLGWVGVSCFGIVSGSCAVCYDGRGVR